MRRSIAAVLMALFCGGAGPANPAIFQPPPNAVAPPVAGMPGGRVGVTTPGTTSTSGSSSSSNTPTNSTNGTTLGALPGPPPSSLTVPPQGVPPTPAPATPGLPAPSSTTRVLPSSTGLGSQINSELRPAGSLSLGQVASVQSALAAGGLYRGPIDGVLSGGTRAAVRLFQQSERLPATGELDAETLARITTGKSTSTPIGSGGSFGAGVGSNGSTATVGNPTTVDPFTGGPIITVTPPMPPFPLSQPINMSPQMAPPGVLIQP